MTRGRLFYTIGLPRSGKTTYANAWLCGPFPGMLGPFARRDNHIFYDSRLDQITIKRPRVVLSGDDFRRAVYQAEYSRTGECLVFGILDTAARALLARGFDVLMDETATTQATLTRYYLIDFDAQPIIIDTPEEECIRRAIEGGKPHLVEPIRMMAEQMKEQLKDWPAAIERVKAAIARRYPNAIVRQA